LRNLIIRATTLMIGLAACVTGQRICKPVAAPVRPAFCPDNDLLKNDRC
jgi:hypothetical protein